MKIRCAMKQYSMLCLTLPALLATAAEPPLVFDRENTAAAYPSLSFPAFEELTFIETLPDPFLCADKSGRTTAYGAWEHRRSEILQQLWHYEIGAKPAPDS
ncbi:MAG: hypothetical protein K2M12_00240 [Muribaculaceae bacterium]|nr:hypothetical protein [Muribaculaceae bacterium]